MDQWRSASTKQWLLTTAMYETDRLLVLAVETVLAVSRPLQIHFLIVQFDKLLDFTQLPVIQNACILQDSIAVSAENRSTGRIVQVQDTHHAVLAEEGIAVDDEVCPLGDFFNFTHSKPSLP